MADPTATTAARSRWWALVALAASTLVVGLDTTVLSVALPTLAVELGAATSQLQWIVDGYNLVLAAALLPAGFLGDRFGRKRLLIAALIAFGMASAWCAYASSPGELIAARVALGVGAAFLMTLPMAVLPVIFGPDERARAITIWSTAMFASFPLGPVVGGLLLDSFWWGSIFLINVPVVVAAVVAVVVLLPESRGSERRRFDVPGLLLSGAGLVALTYGVIEAGEHGWDEGAAQLAMAAGAATLAAFVAWQSRLAAAGRRQPLVDLGLFRSRGFTWGLSLGVVTNFAVFGLLFGVPLYLQVVLDTDALGTGLRLLPMIAGLVVGAQTADRIAPRTGAKAPVAAGFGLMAAALFLGGTTDAGSGYGFTATWIALVGAGLGLAMPTVMDVALGSVPVDRSGMGTSVIMSLRMVGGAIGVAVLGTILNAAYRDRLDVGGLPSGAADAVRDNAVAGVRVAAQTGSATLLDSVRAAFVHGMDTMLLTCGGIAVLGAVVALAFLPQRADGAPATPGVGESEHDVVLA